MIDVEMIVQAFAKRFYDDGEIGVLAGHLQKVAACAGAATTAAPACRSATRHEQGTAAF
jgi:hypothetical protein